MGSSSEESIEGPPPGRVYPGHKVLAMFPVYNEGEKIAQLIERLEPGLADKFIAVNDGSTDEGPRILRDSGIEVLDQDHSGLGACLKHSIRYAKENGYDVLAVMAGNGKDEPRELPRLLEAIVERGVDYVQGSRFLPGGGSPNLPRFRRYAIRLLSLVFSLYSGRRCTDLTNGFRAYRIELVEAPEIDIWQEWLDTYEFEYYLHFKVYTLGYRVEEVPVTKTYPADPAVSYTKIRPGRDWWRMLRPFFYLALRIKH